MTQYHADYRFHKLRSEKKISKMLSQNDIYLLI